MAKLTDRQRKRIIAEYVAGGITQQELAKKFKVSRQAISKILSDEKVAKSCAIKKEENTRSMLEYLDERRDKAQHLIDIVLNSSDEQLEQASIKEKMGAIKILSEVFGKSNDTGTAEGRLNVIVSAIKGEAKDDDEE